MVRLAPIPVLCVMLSLIGSAREPDLRELLARVAAYIEQYERELGTLVSQERYRQQSGVVTGGFSDTPAPGRLGAGTVAPPIPETRELFSEFLVLRLPGTNAQWAGYRNVIEVNGRRVRDRVRRFDAQLFQTATADAVALWTKLNEESSRFNIGPVARTINVPTLALIVLRGDRQAQFKYRIQNAERVDGVDTVVIAFEELEPPTLVSDPQGAKIYTSGRVWVTPAEGSVLRTEFAARPAPGARPLARVTVRYARDKRLNAWVPSQMEEEYYAGAVRVSGLARYSDYRRFETDGRLLPPASLHDH
jgi:hypothetical protein